VDICSTFGASALPIVQPTLERNQPSNQKSLTVSQAYLNDLVADSQKAGHNGNWETVTMTNVLQNLIEKNVNDQKRSGRSWLLENYCYYYYYYYYSHFKASFLGQPG